MTDLYSLSLVANLMMLLHKILSSLAIVAVAVAILMQISAVQLPSLKRVVPKSSKLFIFSSCTLLL